MAHNYNDNGTVYEIGGGKVNMNGTVYEIDHGKVNDNGTVYEIAFAAPLITFYYNHYTGKLTFNCEDGMTWQEFINSKYNTNGAFNIRSNVVLYKNSYEAYLPDWSKAAKANDVIIANCVYESA